jgi:hypothetical protein
VTGSMGSSSCNYTKIVPVMPLTLLRLVLRSSNDMHWYPIISAIHVLLECFSYCSCCNILLEIDIWWRPMETSWTLVCPKRPSSTTRGDIFGEIDNPERESSSNRNERQHSSNGKCSNQFSAVRSNQQHALLTMNRRFLSSN